MKSRAMEEFVENVRAGSDILSVVSAYVSLKKKGNNYWGCCPFHQEKTPSFSVAPDKGFFYCFGCHAGGDVFRFIKMIENISYFDAVKMQAERLNIPLPQREKTEQELKKEQQLNDMYKVLGMAHDFFHNCLTKTPYGAEASKYLQSRGITSEIVEEFGIGFAPNAFDKLSGAFSRRGVSEQQLVDSGLAVQRQGGGVYDRFRNRVMIPIADEFGHVAGFGGRIMDDSQPKYLNSPETLVFNKRRLLFGLDRSKQAIRQQGCAVIVEGYMDAISLFAAGIKNVVASLGTAFTIEQCRKLLRYAPNIYFCYDSDEAGQQATIRALSIVRETGAKVKVLVVPDGKDPDEFVRKHGADAFRKLIENAQPLVEYQIRYVLAHHEYNTLEGKTAALAEIMPVLREITSMVELNDYIARLARTLGIDEGVIRSELSRFSGKSQNLDMAPQPLRKAVRQVDNAVRRAGRIILRAVWHDGDNGSLLSEVAANLSLAEFPFPLHGEILQRIESCLLAGGQPPDVMKNGELSDEAAAELSLALAEDSGEEDEAAYQDALRSLCREELSRQYEMHRQLADAMQRAGNDDYVRELAELKRIKKEMDELRIE